MAVAAVAYRSATGTTTGLPTLAELMPRSKALRPGDVSLVQDDDATWGTSEVELLVLVLLPGEASEWSHLTQSITELVVDPDWQEGDPEEDHYIEETVSKRRFFIDLRSALGVNIQRNLIDRQARLTERDAAAVAIKDKGDAIGEASVEDRANLLKQIQALTKDLDRLDGEITLLRLVPEPVSTEHIYERS